MKKEETKSINNIVKFIKEERKGSEVLKYPT